MEIPAQGMFIRKDNLSQKDKSLVVMLAKAAPNAISALEKCFTRMNCITRGKTLDEIVIAVDKKF